jgi:lysophospholipase L1-like esterase
MKEEKRGSNLTMHRVVKILVFSLLTMVLTLFTGKEKVQAATDTLNVSILGDSISTYSEYTQYSNIGGDYYPGNGNLSSVNDTWWMSVINSHGYNLDSDESLGGSRVTWTGEATDNYYHLGDNYSMSSDKRIASLTKNGVKPDLVIVYGGTNDAICNVNMGNINNITANGRSDFASAYTTTINKIKLFYPGVKIICVAPYNTSSYSASTVANIIQVVAQRTGSTFVNLQSLNMSGYLNSDYIHPNKLGMALISQKINNAIQGTENPTVTISNSVGTVVATANSPSNGLFSKHLYYRWSVFNYQNNQQTVIQDWIQDNNNLSYNLVNNLNLTSGNYELICEIMTQDQRVYRAQILFYYNI